MGEGVKEKRKPVGGENKLIIAVAGIQFERDGKVIGAVPLEFLNGLGFIEGEDGAMVVSAENHTVETRDGQVVARKAGDRVLTSRRDERADEGR